MKELDEFAKQRDALVKQITKKFIKIMENEYNHLVKQFTSMKDTKNIRHVFKNLKILEKIKFLSLIYTKDVVESLECRFVDKIYPFEERSEFANKHEEDFREFFKIIDDTYSKYTKDFLIKRLNKVSQEKYNQLKGKRQENLKKNPVQTIYTTQRVCNRHYLVSEKILLNKQSGYERKNNKIINMYEEELKLSAQ